MSKAVLAKKISPTATILSLPIGIPTPIKHKDIKIGTLKSTITRLRKKGHEIKYTEEGRTDDLLVTLLKWMICLQMPK